MAQQTEALPQSLVLGDLRSIPWNLYGERREPILASCLLTSLPHCGKCMIMLKHKSTLKKKKSEEKAFQVDNQVIFIAGSGKGTEGVGGPEGILSVSSSQSFGACPVAHGCPECQLSSVPSGPGT